MKAILHSACIAESVCMLQRFHSRMQETAAGKGQEMDFDGVQYENVDEGVRFLEEFLKSTSACSCRTVMRETLFSRCVYQCNL